MRRPSRPILPALFLVALSAVPCGAASLRIVEESKDVDGILVDNGFLWATYPWQGVAGLSRNYPFSDSGGTTGYQGLSGGPMTIGPDGNVWWLEYAANRVWKYDFKTYSFTFKNVGAGPIAICAGPDGNVWIVERTANKIARLTSAGVLTEFTIPTAASQPTSIIAALGSLWFTESNTNKIARITPSGVFTEWVVPRVSSGPYAIAHDGSGTLYFTEVVTNRISSFYIEEELFSSSWVVPTANAQPKSIVAGPYGEMWFAEYASNKIGRFYGGLFDEYPIPTPNSGPTQLVNAHDGTLWFIEKNAGKIARIHTSVPGDANQDGQTDVLDVFFLINYLYAGGPAPEIW
jgi:virginiamycin B lyase